MEQQATAPAGLPAERVVLAAFPILFAARFLSTALWSAPVGPISPAVFDAIFYSATLASVYWGCVAHRHLRRSAHIGMALAFICAYRAVTVYPARLTFGRVAYSAVLNWATFSLATLIITMLSIQYVLVHQYQSEIDDEER